MRHPERFAWIGATLLLVGFAVTFLASRTATASARNSLVAAKTAQQEWLLQAAPTSLGGFGPTTHAVFGWTMAMGKVGGASDTLDDLVVTALGETVNGFAVGGAYPFVDANLANHTFAHLLPSPPKTSSMSMGQLGVTIGSVTGPNQTNLVFIGAPFRNIAVPGCAEHPPLQLVGSVEVFNLTQSGAAILKLEPPKDQATDCGPMNVGGFGHSVSLGDVNNDGFDDLVVGAHGSDGGLGRFYVFFGSSTGFTGQDWIGVKAPTDVSYAQFGVSVLCRDFDNDGFAEVVVGRYERGNPCLSTTGPGRVYVFRGRSLANLTHNAAPAVPSSSSYQVLSDPNGLPSDGFGWVTFDVGDMGSVQAGGMDGLPDLALYSEFGSGCSGSPTNNGALFVYFNNSTTVTGSYFDATNFVKLTAAANGTGTVVSTSRYGRGASRVEWQDVNGNVNVGLLVSESGANAGNKTDSGQIFLYWAPITSSSQNAWSAPLVDPFPEDHAHFGAHIVAGKYSNAYSGQQFVASSREHEVSGVTDAGQAYSFRP